MHDEVAPQRNSWIGLKRYIPTAAEAGSIILVVLASSEYLLASRRTCDPVWVAERPTSIRIEYLDALLSIESRDGTRLFPIVESNFEYSSFLPRECNNSRDKILPLPCLFRGMGLKKRRKKKRKRRKGDYCQ